MAVMPLRILLDPRLSWKAKGLLTLLLNVDGGTPMGKMLRLAGADKRASLDAGIQELLTAGYLKEKDGNIIPCDDPAYELPPIMDDAAQPPRKDVGIQQQSTSGRRRKRAGKRARTAVESAGNRQELAHVAKEGGVYKGGKEEDLEVKKELNTVESAVDLFGHDPDKVTLMKNSLVNTFELVLQHFREEEAAGIDVRYYFGSIMDWSTSANKRRTGPGWIATIRNAMRRDHRAGKLKRTGNAEGDNDADLLAYLNT